jgi:methylmalonyl-CoA mutase
MAPAVLQRLETACLKNENGFAALLDAVEHCSLGQITRQLYAVGGEYRRNL